MSAGQHDFTLKQGEQFRRVLTFSTNNALWDLSGKDFQMLVKKGIGGEAVLTASIEIQGTDNSELVLTIPGTDTADIEAGCYKYDLKMWSETDQADAKFLLEGAFHIEGAISV